MRPKNVAADLIASWSRPKSKNIFLFHNWKILGQWRTNKKQLDYKSIFFTKWICPCIKNQMKKSAHLKNIYFMRGFLVSVTLPEKACRVCPVLTRDPARLPSPPDPKILINLFLQTDKGSKMNLLINWRQAWQTGKLQGLSIFFVILTNNEKLFSSK